LKIRPILMKTILSIAIPLLLTALFLAYLHYKFAIRSWKLIIHAVLFGLLASVPLLLLNEGTILKGIYELRNLKRTGFYSFVVVGFGSELGKFILLRYYFQRQKKFPDGFRRYPLCPAHRLVVQYRHTSAFYVGMASGTGQHCFFDYISHCKHCFCRDPGVLRWFGKTAPKPHCGLVDRPWRSQLLSWFLFFHQSHQRIFDLCPIRRRLNRDCRLAFT